MPQKLRHNVTQKAVQLHGGMGYTKSYPVERLMREANSLRFEGTNGSTQRAGHR